MASSLVKINIHLIFHVKSTSVKMRTEHLEEIFRYIGGQAEHHQKRTFQEEYKQFLAAYGIQYDERFAFSD